MYIFRFALNIHVRIYTNMYTLYLKILYALYTVARVVDGEHIKMI